MSNCNWERDLRYTVMNEWKKKDPMMARWSAFDPQGREISFPAVSIKPHSHKNKNQNQKAKTNNKPKRKKKFFLKGHLSKYIGHCKGIVSKALFPPKKVHDAATAFVQTLELDCKKLYQEWDVATQCGLQSHQCGRQRGSGRKGPFLVCSKPLDPKSHVG